jgi:signal transduction histidine kinase
MKRHHVFDSIAWWFALNVAGAILIALLMCMVFVQFAGVWAQPSVESAGLIEQAAGIALTIDKVPATERAQLALKLTTPAFATQWYPQRDQVPISADHDKKEHDARWVKLTRMLGRPDAGVLASSPDDVAANAAPALRKYAIAIELSDHSWIMFDTAQRSWGIDRGLQILLTILFLLLSSGIIASAAGRRLARPVQRFADAAETFGAGSRAEPLPLVGPLEIREAAAAFNAMQERIQQLMDSRTEMLTAISHDLRAPLTRMRLRGEFIEDNEQQRKLFRDVDEMQAMVEASLAFFRLDGKQEEMTRFELGELIHTVVDDFRDIGQPVESANLMPLVYLGRPLALKRVLTNLIDNAVKYGSRARITLSAQNSQVIITIDDDGPGVPPSLIPKLFLPFFRIEASRNRATGGFGLGLPSARSIMRNHGGELTLENRQPHGLRATVFLPNASGDM